MNYRLIEGVQTVECPNFFEGRQGYQVKAIVIHKPEGELQGVVEYLQNPSTQKSYHYIIAKDGRVVQLVDTENAAWHCGIVDAPTWPDLVQGANPNLYTIGIALEGFATDPCTEQQYFALAKLMGDIAFNYQLKLNDKTVVFHREIEASKSCPGFFVDKYSVIVAAQSGVSLLNTCLEQTVVAQPTLAMQ